MSQETAASRCQDSEETTLHIDYVPVLDFIAGYRPELSCKEHLLRDVGPAMNEMPLFERVVEDCDQIARSRLLRIPANAPDRLTPDGALAVVLYSYDLGTKSQKMGADNFFVLLNNQLRQRSGEALERLRPYLWYFMRSLESLPRINTRVYRGIGKNQLALVKERYELMTHVHWSAFSSTTTSIDIAKRFAQRGGIIFRILIHDGRNIQKYSAIPREDEILLGPNSRFVVTEGVALDEASGYYFLTLMQIKEQFVF
jgi:hypothetical protein